MQCSICLSHSPSHTTILATSQVQFQHTTLYLASTPILEHPHTVHVKQHRSALTALTAAHSHTPKHTTHTIAFERCILCTSMLRFRQHSSACGFMAVRICIHSHAHAFTCKPSMHTQLAAVCYCAAGTALLAIFSCAQLSHAFSRCSCCVCCHAFTCITVHTAPCLSIPYQPTAELHMHSKYCSSRDISYCSPHGVVSDSIGARAQYSCSTHFAYTHTLTTFVCSNGLKGGVYF